MDFKLLIKSILFTLGITTLIFLLVLGLTFLFNHVSAGWVVAFFLFASMGMMVAVDYERRKFNEKFKINIKK